MYLYPKALRYSQIVAGVLSLLVIMLVFALLFAEWSWISEKVAKNMAPVVNTYKKVIPIALTGIITTVGVLAMELFIVGYQKSSLKRILTPSKTVVADIIMWVLVTSQLDYVIVYVLSLGLISKLRVGLIDLVGIDAGIIRSIDNVFIQVLLYIILIDFVAYLTHVANHKFALLWTFHKYHHSATEMTVLNSKRAHPFEKHFLNKLLFLVPMTFIGIPLVSVVIYRIIRQVFTYLQHSQLDWTWGWFGKYVIIAPHYHRIHHSAASEHIDKNFGVLLILWDQLFGTFEAGDVKEIEFGIPGNPFNKRSFVSDMLHPFKEAWRLFFKKSG